METSACKHLNQGKERTKKQQKTYTEETGLPASLVTLSNYYYILFSVLYSCLHLHIPIQFC